MQLPPPPVVEDLPPLVDQLPPVDAPAPPPVVELPVIEIPYLRPRGQDTIVHSSTYVIAPPVADDGLVGVDDLYGGSSHTGPLPIF